MSRHTLSLLVFLLALATPWHPALAVSSAPLQILTALIESDPSCPATLVDWNRKYSALVIAGEVPRDFYYRVLGFQEWRTCGQPYYKRIFGEFQKSWLIYQRKKVDDRQIEAKEAELINLLISARQAGAMGESQVDSYEQAIRNFLFNMEPERQYYDCTLFGGQPRCLY
jgi:hypothetical protein